jgi:hypothetical protein
MGKTKKQKLEMVPAGEAKEVLAPTDFIVEQMPDKSKLIKLNLPTLLKPGSVPIGATVSGTVVKLIQNFTGDKKMKKSCVLEIHHPRTDRSFLFALTGTVRKAVMPFLVVKGEDDDDNQITELKPGKDGLAGKTIFLTRREDGVAKKFGGNKMFNFDVAIAA